MKYQDRLFVLSLVLLMVGVVLVGCMGTSPTQPQVETPAAQEEAAAAGGDVYKIGFVAAVTGPGSGLGEPERNTAEMMARQLEEQGGVTGPDGVQHPVEVIMLDSESNPDTAASAVNRLITEEEVDVLVAGTLSGNSMAMVPLATEAETPMISMASARSIVANEDGSARKWIFKTPQENIHSAHWQADYLAAQGLRSVCFLYENSGYGQDTLASAEKAFAEEEIEIVYSDTFERSDTEFPQVVSVTGAGCEAVVVGSIPPGASLVAAALRDALPDMPIIQGHGVCNQQFIDLAPDAVEGTPLPCGRLLVADTLPDDDPQKEVLLTYIDDYKKATDGAPISTFGGHAYDGMQWAIEALTSLDAGLSLAERRAAIRDYIEANIKDWPGTGGIFNITPQDHLGLEYTGLTFVTIRDGEYIYFPPEEW